MRMIMVKQNGCVMLDSVSGCFQVFLSFALGFWGEISSLKRDKKIENKSGSRSMKWKTSWFNFESWEKRDFRSAWGRVWSAIWKIYPPIVIVWIKVWLCFWVNLEFMETKVAALRGNNSCVWKNLFFGWPGSTHLTHDPIIRPGRV
jgi:hypothetical protein